MKQITVLSFSERENGNCARTGEFISEYYNRTNVQQFAVSADLVSPCGKCDCECLRPGKECPKLGREYVALMDAICSSDLVYFIIPNYCGFPCANYFAFNERSVGYFGSQKKKLEQYMNVRKRFVIISNTEGFETAVRQQTEINPEILYLKSRAYGKRSIDGDILDSEMARADLRAFLSEDAG